MNRTIARALALEPDPNPNPDPNRNPNPNQGGGACWNELTCGLSKPTFRETVDDLRPRFAAINGRPPAAMSGGAAGADNLMDAGLSDPNGPFAEWTHVYVPYVSEPSGRAPEQPLPSPEPQPEP